jgi:hypothetical protein
MDGGNLSRSSHNLKFLNRMLIFSKDPVTDIRMTLFAQYYASD